MEAFITFAKDAAPISLALAALLGMIHIMILILEGRGIIKKNTRTSEANQMLNVVELQTLKNIDFNVHKVMTNHLHELPEMKQSIDGIKESVVRIEGSLNSLNDHVGNLRERVARLEK